GPYTLNKHFEEKDNREEGKKSDPHTKPSHPKTICRHQVQQVHRHQRAENTKNDADLSPRRLEDATAQDPSSSLDHLGSESQHNREDRHDKSNNHKNDMKGQERYEPIVVRRFRAAETFLPFKGQHAQLSEQI